MKDRRLVLATGIAPVVLAVLLISGIVVSTPSISPSDKIQILILCTYIITLSISIITMMLVYNQITIQNNIFKAQSLTDRLEMYWKLYEPVSDGHIEALESMVDDYMPVDLYETSYKGNKILIKRYIMMLQIYEYLAFNHTLQKERLYDPLGYQWVEKWTKNLSYKKEFMDVHEYHKEYYQEFGQFVEDIIKEPSRPQRRQS